MLIQPNSRVLFIGDSITDCGRARPIAEGGHDPLGRGFVNLVNALVGTVYPELSLRVTNMGTSGNTVRDLAGRWQTDVIDLAPDWLAVMIGINDVWRQFDLPYIPERHVLPDEYERTLRQLVTSTRSALEGLVLMTPYYIESDRHDPMRRRMDEYGQIVKAIAKDNSAIFVDTQAAFDAVLEHVYPAALAWDRIHCTPTGHTIIAKAFLDAVGFKWG